MPRPTIELDPAREEDELREYLGSSYDHSRLQRYERQLDEELARVGDEEAFYRSSEGYLYNLTAFAMTATKLPYLQEIVRRVPPPAHLLDWGCGIGSDGLMLLEAGYRVAFADFDNPSTRYLRWRLERRELTADVYDLDRAEPPAGFDLAYAFDVIEHVEDPFALLRALERSARLVLVNLLEPEPGGTPLHRELPIRALLDHAAERTLLRHRRHHGRSHLVLYGSRQARGAGRLRALALRRFGDLRFMSRG